MTMMQSCSRIVVTKLSYKQNNVMLVRHVHVATSCRPKDSQHNVTLDNINENVKRLEYAVRGPLVIRAGEIERQLKENPGSKTYKSVLRANMGDCQSMGQKPLTFLRQVLACATDTQLMEANIYPNDVKKRVKELLNYCGGNSVGSYSDSAGVEIIRRHCAEYIKRRDGIDSEWQNIVLTNGTSDGIQAVLSLVNSSSTDSKPSGVMAPIPLYPLYSATIAEYGMSQINYYLDEANQWELDIGELKRAINMAREKCIPKVLVVLNPCNPTGSVLSRRNIADIIQFAKDEKLLIIADEVYQHNIYEGEFVSFKKMMHDMNVDLELVSVMSASKGYMGECGLRAGYCELVNFDSNVKQMFLKMLSVKICSSVLGQIALDCVVKPPEKNEQSHDLYELEKQEVLSALKYRAQLVADSFNAIPGINSNKVAGAMYAFPRINIPMKAIIKAEQLKQAPDFFYTMQLLESTGICVVPGSGFGQLPGTHHFRTTILPQNEKLEQMLQTFKQFHLKFMDQYS